jgi:hypothetical protein
MTMRGRLASPGGDRGSIALFVVIFSLAVLLLASMLADVGGAMSDRERAADAAEQAARAAADSVDLSGLRTGKVSIDLATGCIRARQLLRQYANQNNLRLTESSCVPDPPAKVTVGVTVVTRPVLLPMSFTMTVAESACAEIEEENC